MLKKILVLLISVVLIIGIAGGCSGSKNKIVVASKQYTENIILAEIYSQLIEDKTDLKVVRKLNLGGTSVLQPAMKNKEIDLYVEYTGTICGEILKMDTQDGFTAEKALENAVKGAQEELDYKFFTPPLLLNNTYAIGLPRAKAEELGITKLSELKDHAPNLKFGGNHMFYTRVADGFDAMCDTYDLNFMEALKMDQTLIYEASSSGELDVLMAYATDSLLTKYDIVLLEDDKELFPPYNGSPMCRNDVLEAHPELNDVLGLLGGTIDDSDMQQLNYEVDIEKRSVEDVAREFLKENGYID